MTRSIAALSSALALGACVHSGVLEPGVGARLAPGTKDVAEATNAGVTLEATGNSWKGNPPDLDRLFTPVRVTIENHSGKPVRVNYLGLNLEGSSGFTYSAVPPIRARRELSLGDAPPPPHLTLAGGWEHRGFYVAPQYSYFYPSLQPWTGKFAYDPLYYDESYQSWPERLPTDDMLSQALPEGVVENGGRVSGFVYFQNVTHRESAVRLEMDLVDASDGKEFGTIGIPFQTKQD